MSATIHALERPTGARPSALRAPRQTIARSVPHDHAWLVDGGALAEARELLAGHELPEATARAAQPALLDVHPAYEQFCRSHFASVRRLHPDIEWSEACFAYALALSAHAVLCDALGAEQERRLEQAWPRLRGEAQLPWKQARSLVADGCRALARLDPLAMRR